MKTSNYKVLILMATYNGESFLHNQINSIRDQSFTNWELLIRDDGSTDDTVKIIDHYCDLDKRITRLNNNSRNLGACQNFGELVRASFDREYDLLMFSDQDDFWFESKISSCVNLMEKKDNSANIPRLIYTDFIFTDEKLVRLDHATEFTKHWKEPNLHRILAQNNIYGCTMLLNKILVQKIHPIPNEAENHDYWIALVAASIGEIHHLKSKTLLYRQHSRNVSGSYLDSSINKRILRYLRAKSPMKKITKGRLLMASKFFERFKYELDENQCRIVKEYSKLDGHNRFYRIFFCMRHGIRKDSILQTLAFYYNIFVL